MDFFDIEEIKNITISSVIIAIIFSMRNLSQFLFFFSSSILSIFPAFLLSKYVANKMGGKCTVKLNFTGTIVGILLSLIGIKICPVITIEPYGYKFGRWNRKILWLTTEEHGIVALSFVIALIFVGTFFYLLGFRKTASLNAWLALSLMIPVAKLEGEKIVRWDFGIWVFFLLVCILFLIFVGIL